MSPCVWHKLATYHRVDFSIDFERLSLCDGDLLTETVCRCDRFGEEVDGVGELVAPTVFVASVAQMARVVPRCPGVFPGRSRGGRHLGPVGRVALPGVPGTSQGGVNPEVRPEKKLSVFMIFFG